MKTRLRINRMVLTPLLVFSLAFGALLSLPTRTEAAWSMWLGSSYAKDAQWNERYVDGKAQIVRVFEPNAPKEFFDYPQIQRTWDNGVRRYSFSFKSANVTALRTFGASLPSGAIVWATYRHEPENDIERGDITLQQYKNNWVKLAPVMREYGMRPTSILMAWTLTDYSGRDVKDYDLPAGTVDFAGYDAHIRNSKPPKMLANLLKAEAARINIPWVIPETSVLRDDPKAVERMEKFMRLMKNAPKKPRFITYWNGSGRGDARITNKVSKAFFGY